MFQLESSVIKAYPSSSQLRFVAEPLFYREPPNYRVPLERALHLVCSNAAEGPVAKHLPTSGDSERSLSRES